jgi:hypothetical protein
MLSKFWTSFIYAPPLLTTVLVMLFLAEFTRLPLMYQLISGAPVYTTQLPNSESNKITLVAVYVLLTFPRKATSMSMDRKKHDIFFSENIHNCLIFYVVYFR